jgi:hypothetical protein
MITYTWSIFRLDCAPLENGLTDVVKMIHWGLTGIDENGVSASFSNSYPLSSPTPEAFTDYATLTEETVIGWLESNLDVGYLQTVITNEITSKYNPPITPLPLPWEKTESTLEEMIADGYNPDARDGDGDGLVQDGTDWERHIDS